MFEDFDVFFDDANKCYQVRTKVNSFVLDFDDDDKKLIFEKLITLPKSSLGKSFSKLKKEFEVGKVIDVFSNLKDYGLLPPEEISQIPELESAEAQDGGWAGELKAMEELHILILSDSTFGEILKKTLQENNIKSIDFISPSSFISLSPEQIDEKLEKSDFCFVDASRWNPKALELLNKHSIKLKKPWLHIGGFEEYMLKIGPLFLGTETGCYSCFIKRVKSNHEYIEYLGPYERHLKNKNKSSKPDKFINEEAFYGILANMAFIELSKFFQMWSVPSTWRKLITVSSLDFETTGHDLLKVPFCETCNELQAYNPSPWLEPISI